MSRASESRERANLIASIAPRVEETIWAALEKGLTPNDIEAITEMAIDDWKTEQKEKEES